MLPVQCSYSPFIVTECMHVQVYQTLPHVYKYTYYAQYHSGSGLPYLYGNTYHVGKALLTAVTPYMVYVCCAMYVFLSCSGRVQHMQQWIQHIPSNLINAYPESYVHKTLLFKFCKRLSREVISGKVYTETFTSGIPSTWWDIRNYGVTLQIT